MFWSERSSLWASDFIIFGWSESKADALRETACGQQQLANTFWLRTWSGSIASPQSLLQQMFLDTINNPWEK